jgi:hypothetical protein
MMRTLVLSTCCRYMGPPEKAKSIAGQLVSAIKTR